MGFIKSSKTDIGNKITMWIRDHKNYELKNLFPVYIWNQTKNGYNIIRDRRFENGHHIRNCKIGAIKETEEFQILSTNDNTIVPISDFILKTPNKVVQVEPLAMLYNSDDAEFNAPGPCRICGVIIPSTCSRTSLLAKLRRGPLNVDVGRQNETDVKNAF